MKVKALRCPHPKCGSRMARLYTRAVVGRRYQYIPVGWLCKECGISQIEKSLTAPPNTPQ